MLKRLVMCRDVKGCKEWTGAHFEAVKVLADERRSVKNLTTIRREMPWL